MPQEALNPEVFHVGHRYILDILSALGSGRINPKMSFMGLHGIFPRQKAYIAFEQKETGRQIIYQEA